MPQEVFKNPQDLVNSMNRKPTLRDRWNKYLKYGFGGTNVDKWNKEISDIEQQLPFIDQAEHDKRLNLGSEWNGEDEWLNMTDEILKRVEQ